MDFLFITGTANEKKENGKTFLLAWKVFEKKTKSM